MDSYINSLSRFLAHKEAEGKERRDALSKRLARATEVLTQQFPQITRVAVMGTFLSPGRLKQAPVLYSQ